MDKGIIPGPHLLVAGRAIVASGTYGPKGFAPHVVQYRGWQKGIDPEPKRILKKRQSFALALQSGVKICAGGDVGVFPHGENTRELIMMADFGMEPLEVLPFLKRNR